MKTSILILLLVFTLNPYSAMSQISEADQEKADKLYVQAHEAFYDENYDKAYLLIKQTMELNPNRDGGYWLRGRIRWKMGNDASALDDLAQAIKQDPKNEVIYSHIADIYIEGKQPQKAHDAYSQGIALFPKATSLYSQRAKLARKNHWYEKALADYEKLLQLKPNDPSYLRGKAITLGKLGKKNEEAIIYKYLLKTYPQNPDLYQIVGGIYHVDKQDYPTAAQYYQRALQWAKTNTEKESCLSGLNQALWAWRDQVFRQATDMFMAHKYKENLDWSELSLLLFYANTDSKGTPDLTLIDQNFSRAQLKINAPTNTTFYWEHPTYAQAWKHYKAQEWAKAKTQFQALQKVFAKETVLGKAVEICDLMLGNYTLEEEKK